MVREGHVESAKEGMAELVFAGTIDAETRAVSAVLFVACASVHVKNGLHRSSRHPIRSQRGAPIVSIARAHVNQGWLQLCGLKSGGRRDV